VKSQEVERLVTEAKTKRDEIKKADLSWLTKPKRKGKIPHPSLLGKLSDRFCFNKKTGEFEFMGRLALQDLIDGVADSKQNVINIMGTKYFGKSHIIAAYVTQRMQACFSKQTNARPILFLPKCGDLAEYQEVYLKNAMLLAFAADDEVLSEIAAIPKETNVLLRWLDDKKFDVVADQGNDIQEKSMLDPILKQKAKEIMEALKKFVSQHKECKILTGYSANNEIMTLKFYKERTEEDLTFYGGFEEKVCCSCLCCSFALL
jgi:hypothetical protein